MATPKEEIEALQRGFESENAPYLKDDLAFAVARCIVKYHDPDLLRQFSPWVSEMVGEMCDIYERDGSYGIISNLGEVDHSEMVSQLVKLLRPGH